MAIKSKSKIFLFCCVFFIVGIAVSSFLPLSAVARGLWWFGAMVFCLAVLILSRSFSWNKKIGLIALFGFSLFLGVWRYSISWPQNTPDKIWFYNGQTVVIIGTVCNEPDVRNKNRKLEVEITKIAEPGISEQKSKQAHWREVRGKVLLTTDSYPAYTYGDEIEFVCELKKPEKFQDFAYDRYLARYDIYSVCYYPEIELLRRNQKNKFYASIFQLKNKLYEVIQVGLFEPEASLAGAIFLGYKKNILPYWQNKFSQAGISHIIAISGLHISILAALVMNLFLGIGLFRQKAFYLGSLFLLLYIILVGLPASAMRAGLMGFLVLLAMNLGRINRLVNSLVLVAVILLFMNPRLLRDDIGFQLSFLAVLGIAYVVPIFKRWTGERQGIVGIVFDIFNVTLAAQVFTLPVIVYNFSQVSLIAPISNLLILWSLPLLMIAILIGLFFGLVFPFVTTLFFVPAFLILKYINLVADWLPRFPYAYIKVDYLWPGWMAVYYLSIIWAIFKFKEERGQ